jgi:hypothetical protein
MEGQIVKPDARGRVSLKKFVGDVAKYTLKVNEDGSLLLLPSKKAAHPVPTSEKWLYSNPKARLALEKGLMEAAHGQVVSLGSFAKYAV